MGREENGAGLQRGLEEERSMKRAVLAGVLFCAGALTLAGLILGCIGFMMAGFQADNLQEQGEHRWYRTVWLSDQADEQTAWLPSGQWFGIRFW